MTWMREVRRMELRTLMCLLDELENVEDIMRPQDSYTAIAFELRVLKYQSGFVNIGDLSVEI